MKQIKLLKRTFVMGIGTCEAESVTTCDDKVAEQLIKSKHAVAAKKRR